MFFFFFFNDPATTEIYTLSLHDALPIWKIGVTVSANHDRVWAIVEADSGGRRRPSQPRRWPTRDRKSTRLNSSHDQISYAVFCLKKKKKDKRRHRPSI